MRCALWQPPGLAWPQPLASVSMLGFEATDLLPEDGLWAMFLFVLDLDSHVYPMSLVPSLTTWVSVLWPGLWGCLGQGPEFHTRLY